MKRWGKVNGRFRIQLFEHASSKLLLPIVCFSGLAASEDKQKTCEDLHRFALGELRREEPRVLRIPRTELFGDFNNSAIDVLAIHGLAA